MIRVSIILFVILVNVFVNGQFSEFDIPELEYLNTKIDPCDDFYQFTCGNFKKLHPLPPDAENIDNFNILSDELLQLGNEIVSQPIEQSDPIAVRKIKTAYSACVDTAYADQLPGPEHFLFPNLSHIPIITPESTPTPTFTLGDLGRLVGKTGIPLFFKVDIQQFSRNSPIVLVQKDDAQASLNEIRSQVEKSYDEIVLELIEELKNNIETKNASKASINKIKRTKALKDLLIKLARNLVRTGPLISRSEQELEDDIDDVLYLLANSNGIPGDNVKKFDYFPITIEQLQAWTDDAFPNHTMFNWLEYFEGVFNPAGINVSIPDFSLYPAFASDYVYGILNLMQSTNPRILKNFALLRTFLFLAPDSDAVTRTAFEDFLNAIDYKVEERWVYCTKKVLEGESDSNGFSFPAVYQLQNYHFNKNKIASATEMMSQVKNAFWKAITGSNWMDEETITKAVLKLDKMVVLLGWPDFIEDESTLDQFYENVPICKWNHYGNSATIRAFQRAYSLIPFKTKNTLDHWNFSPFTVNTKYNGNNNRIVLPFSLLYNLFFNGTNPIIDFSRIGSIMSHEITHGFDTEGSQQDENGAATGNWWSNATLEQYNDRMHCFTEQYDKYYVDEIATFVNGTRTINENIADNGGLKDSFVAFQQYVKENNIWSSSKQYSLEQLFFISYGTLWCSNESPSYLKNLVETDAHSPSRFRIEGALVNSKEFGKAFNCPVGSRMNPRNKCSLW